MCNTLYVLNDQGTLYWGSYMVSSPNNFHGQWVFRPEPMWEHRWYISKGLAVRYSLTTGQGRHDIVYLESFYRRNGMWISGNHEICSTAHVSFWVINQTTMFAREPKLNTHLQRRNEILNRRQEYEGAPIFPLSKGNETFRQRWQQTEAA